MRPTNRVSGARPGPNETPSNGLGRWWRVVVVVAIAAGFAIPTLAAFNTTNTVSAHSSAKWSTDTAVDAGINLTSVSAPTTPGGGWTVTFRATVSGGTGPYSCSWTTSDGGSGSSCTTFTHIFDTVGVATIALSACDSGRVCGNANTQAGTQLCNADDGCNWYIICRSFGGGAGCFGPIHPCNVDGWDATLTSHTPVTWLNQANGVNIGTSSTWSDSITSSGTVTFSSTMTDSIGDHYTSSGSMGFG